MGVGCTRVHGRRVYSCAWASERYFPGGCQ